MFDNLGHSSLLTLITLSLNTQIEVYKACRLPQLLNNSCLNSQRNPNSRTSNPLLWLFNHTFFSLHFISYFHLLFFYPFKFIIWFLCCWLPFFYGSHITHISISCKCEKEKPKIFLPLWGTPPSSKVSLLPLANENATILYNFLSSNQWLSSHLWFDDNWRGRFIHQPTQ